MFHTRKRTWNWRGRRIVQRIMCGVTTFSCHLHKMWAFNGSYGRKNQFPTDYHNIIFYKIPCDRFFPFCLSFTTHKVISETLRMANIVNAIWRKAVKDVEIKGKFLKKKEAMICTLWPWSICTQFDATILTVCRVFDSKGLVCCGIS